MAGTIFWLGAIRVFVAAEDHPPPHVHAHHTGDGWSARFRFSFLSDVVGLYRFRRHQLRPTIAMLNAVGDAIMQDLPACRAEWWRTHGTRNGIGLVNQRIEIRTGPGGEGMLTKVALEPSRTSLRIVAASYKIDSRRISVSLADGRRLLLEAGRHIEEADEW